MIRQLWTAPNQLTLLRLVFIPLIVMFVADGEYGWALGLFIAAGVSDALDGLLARLLHQKTLLGQFLDPIADKLLLSTLFLVLSFQGDIPWKVTVLVMSRDVLIIVVCAVLYATVGLQDFQPSLAGKLNTIVQVVALGFVLLAEVVAQPGVALAKAVALWLVFALTILSGVHYIWRTGQQLRHANHGRAGTP